MASDMISFLEVRKTRKSSEEESRVEDILHELQGNIFLMLINGFTMFLISQI